MWSDGTNSLLIARRRLLSCGTFRAAITNGMTVEQAIMCRQTSDVWLSHVVWRCHVALTFRWSAWFVSDTRCCEILFEQHWNNIEHWNGSVPIWSELHFRNHARYNLDMLKIQLGVVVWWRGHKTAQETRYKNKKKGNTNITENNKTWHIVAGQTNSRIK